MKTKMKLICIIALIICMLVPCSKVFAGERDREIVSTTILAKTTEKSVEHITAMPTSEKVGGSGANLGKGTEKSSGINPDDYKVTPEARNDGEVMKFGKTVISIINLIGIIVLFITVAVIGVKYILGSLEERAEYKKTMIPVLIGAVLLFSLTSIINFIYSFVTSN